MPTKEYWMDRWRVEGPKATELHGADLEAQQGIDRERESFIFSKIPLDRKTYDFGCGFGKWARKFPRYCGMDWNEAALEEARKRNPEKDFKLPEEIFDSPILFFTANVLQHNYDREVLRILSLVKSHSPNFAFYEIEKVQLPHVFGRSTEDYENLLVRAGFQVDFSTSYSHVVHMQLHTLSIMCCGGEG